MRVDDAQTPQTIATRAIRDGGTQRSNAHRERQTERIDIPNVWHGQTQTDTSTMPTQTRPMIEIDELPYSHGQEYPLVRVCWWRSTDERYTIVFKETNPAYRQLKPVGALIGNVPPAVRNELAELGYSIELPHVG